MLDLAERLHIFCSYVDFILVYMLVFFLRVKLTAWHKFVLNSTMSSVRDSLINYGDHLPEKEGQEMAEN